MTFLCTDLGRIFSVLYALHICGSIPVNMMYFLNKISEKNIYLDVSPTMILIAEYLTKLNENDFKNLTVI